MLSQHPCGLYIKQIHDTLGKWANNELRGKDLTLSQLAVLMTLYDFTGKYASMKDLERLLHVAQSTMSGIVARLEQKGFLEGYGDVSDKRIKMVRITEKGESYCLEAKSSMELAEKHLLSGLTIEEQEIFRNLLKKVSDYIK